MKLLHLWRVYMKKKIIIIGAGISGLSLAARLLYKGFDVVIFEKNSRIGGKTNLLKSGNFNFDLTASIAMLPEDFVSVFRECGKNYGDYFSLLPLFPLYRCFYADNSFYDFSPDLPSLNRTLKRITNNDADEIEGFHNFINANYKKYLEINKNFLNKSFLKSYNLLKPSSIGSAADLNLSLSCMAEGRKYLNNEKLLEYLMFQSMYIGVSPYKSSSIYNTIPASSQMEGLYYVKGGIYKYIVALEKLVHDLGGKIKTCHEVTEILFKKDKAYGIICHEKIYKAHAVVCSCDYTSGLNNLIKDAKMKKLFKRRKKYDHSCSVFMLYLAVDKKYPILKVHNIYINENFKKNINAAFKGFLPSEPSLYIYCPSSVDRFICPQGYEIINLMVRVPNLSKNKVKWNFETCSKMKNKLLNILSSINTMEDIKHHILYDNFLTPVDLRDKFNLAEGSAFGISHSIGESLIFRPQCCNPKVKNLYFTGASTHPGNGISLCLKSSKICAHKIFKDYL